MSIVNLSILITGADSGERNTQALNLAREYSSTFDTIILDATESAGIGAVKDLLAKTSRRPFNSSCQTFIILESQNLTLEAQNALLKTLEEPPNSSRFILTAPTSESLLHTINSRCQKLELVRRNEPAGEAKTSVPFLSGNLFERYQTASNLDLDQWLSLWRNILLSRFGLGTKQFSATGPTRRLLGYIKMINKMRALQRKRASPKLIKSILLLEAPKVLVK